MPEVIAIARQGLAIGGPAEVGFDKVTLPYVPGSTLRGALATAWIQEHGIPDTANPRREEFIALFERDIRYGPLLQDGTAVVPLSAVWCKYPATPACEQWSADAAVDGDAATCPHCGQGIETGKGEVTGVTTRRVLRTRLDAQGRAMDGYLYARHELEAGLTYRGHLTASHPWLGRPRDVWLGGRTSTRGLATIQVAPQPGDAAVPAIPGSPRADGSLVVRFASPAVIVDAAGRPTLDPLPEILRVLGMPAAALAQKRYWTRPVRAGGWHAASGLPKPVELAIAMGSVAVLGLREPPGIEQLRQLAVAGIGLRQIEGFGSVEVNPPPWRKPLPPAGAEAVTGAETELSVLAGLRDQGMLDSETMLRWLIDRCRRVLIERARDPGYSFTSLLTERVAVFFDDAQADAVLELFASPRLGAAIPLLEQDLARLTSPGPGSPDGGQE